MRWAACLLALCVPLSAPLATPSAALDIQATIGFSNTFRPGHWTPLTITVSNHGRDLSGYLEVRTRAGDGFRGKLFDTTHRRHIDLTRDSRKRVHFTVLLPGITHPLLVRMVVGGTEVAARHIDLRTHFTANRLLLVVSRDANMDYLNDNDGAGIRVLYPHPELLPEQWQGYDAVSAVILHGVSLEQLSTRQYEALRKWIAQGGTFAVSGSADYAWLRTPRMVELLPATPTGMVAITEPASVRTVFAQPLEIDAPLLINRVSASQANISVRAANIPLVVESRLGLGRIVYLTFDVARAPFDRWPGMRKTWLDLLHIGAAPTLDALVDATPSPVTEMLALQSSDLPGHGFPGHGTLLLFLALYLSVLVTGYRFTATVTAMRWLLPLATWAAPALFAPAAYFLFGSALFDRGSSVAAVAVIEPLGDSTYAHVLLDLGIYSSRDGDESRHRKDDNSGTMSLSYTGLEPTLRTPEFLLQHRNPSGARNNTPVGWILSEGTPRTLTPDDARRYALHLLEGEDIIDFDLRATIDLEQRGDGPNRHTTPRMKVHNNSGRPLHDVWLVAGNRAWSVGSIAARGTSSYRIDSEGFELSSRDSEWWDQLKRHPQANTGNMRLLKTLIARKDSMTAESRHTSYPGLGTALLVASTSHPLLPTGSSARWQHTARTLVLLTIPATLLLKDESSVTDL